LEGHVEEKDVVEATTRLTTFSQTPELSQGHLRSAVERLEFQQARGKREQLTNERYRLLGRLSEEEMVANTFPV